MGVMRNKSNNTRMLTGGERPFYTDYFACEKKRDRYCFAGWSSCREEFHRAFNTKSSDHEGLYFVTHHKVSVAELLDYVESKLNLRDRSIIFDCEFWRDAQVVAGSVPILYIKLSPFWLSTRIRSFFVTILIRAGHRYRTLTTFEKVKTSRYCSDTRRATAMFLDGCTVFDNKYWKSWVFQFYNRETGYKKLIPLRRPRTSEEKQFFVDGSVVSRLTHDEKTNMRSWIMAAENGPRFPSFPIERVRASNPFQLEL